MARDRAGRDEPGNGGAGRDGKATRPAESVGTIFARVMRDVGAAARRQRFTGAVDLGVTFESVAVDEEGWLTVVVGGADTKRTSTQIRLSTRMHFDAGVQAGAGEGPGPE